MKPQEIDEITFAYPAKVKNLMPEYKDIPDEFKHHTGKWNNIFSKWFFEGLPQGTAFFPKENIDPEKAMRHINTIMRSFEPQHEHKEAACAYLMSLWFDDVKFPDKK